MFSVDVHFVTPLSDIDCKEEETITFFCEINKSDCNAVWKKDSQPLPPDTRFETMVQGKEHSLIIRDVMLDDEADYTIVIEDAESTAGLFVEEELVEIITPLQDVVLSDVPKDVVFTCTANKPALSHKWILNGKPLPDDKTKFLCTSDDNSYTLTIKGATEKDDGEYTVVIKGHKSTADLIVEIPPQIKLHKKYDDQIVLKARQTTIFEVPFSGWPAPMVSWRLNDEPLEMSKHIHEETISGLSCIHVKSAKRSHTGIYAVEIVNDLATVTAKIDLLVVDKPEPPENVKVGETNEDSVTIYWEPPADDGGKPVTGYIIEKRDMNRRTWAPAGETSELKFTIVELIEGQGYMFQVKAVNEIGVSEPTETEQPGKPISNNSM